MAQLRPVKDLDLGAGRESWTDGPAQIPPEKLWNAVSDSTKTVTDDLEIATQEQPA